MRSHTSLFNRIPVPVENQIQFIFYNAICDYVLSSGEFDAHNIQSKICDAIMHLTETILKRSAGSEGIRLSESIVVTERNCPARYLELFGLLLQLKTSNEINADELQLVAVQMISLPSFEAINPANFLLGMQDNEVTADLIRRTFYDEMPIQVLLALDNEWLTREDIEDEENKIYTALPALTIIEAILKSADCDGIRVLNNKIFNTKSCPQTENFPVLLQAILSIKPFILKLSAEQLNVVRHILACDKDLPAELEQYRTTELMRVIATINGMAIQITQSPFFAKMVQEVLSIFIQKPQPASEAASSNQSYRQ